MNGGLRGVKKVLEEIKVSIVRLGMTPEKRRCAEVIDMINSNWVSFVEEQHRSRGWVSLEQLEKEYYEGLQNRKGVK